MENVLNPQSGCQHKAQGGVRCARNPGNIGEKHLAREGGQQSLVYKYLSPTFVGLLIPFDPFLGLAPAIICAIREAVLYV